MVNILSTLFQGLRPAILHLVQKNNSKNWLLWGAQTLVNQVEYVISCMCNLTYYFVQASQVLCRPP